MVGIPLIDLTPLRADPYAAGDVAQQIATACESVGFFYVIGHGIDEALQERLVTLSRAFFTQDLATKLRIRMALGGRAWRGYFPVGDELTSGQPDLKEGLYFGAELADDHPAVRAGVPMHGRNLFPDMPGFRETVLEYIAAVTGLGHLLMRGIALSLGLDAGYFESRYTADPFVLFRIFHYPAPDAADSTWGVGEHTDYGLLTILKQDDSGGLQVKSQGEWIAAPPIANSFVCNLGDMLDRMTGGRYRSTPHRVRNPSARGRLSFPFFFDPNFDARVEAIPLVRTVRDDSPQRWDGANVHTFEGTYGDYVLGKVAKVFPDLHKSVG